MKRLFLFLSFALTAPFVLAQDEMEDFSGEESNGSMSAPTLRNEVAKESNNKYGESGNIIDGIADRQHIKNKNNLKHAYVREANVLWSKTIWRMLDLRETQNQYLYYPVTANVVDGRRSLARVLVEAILDDGVVVYDPFFTSSTEFNQSVTTESLMQSLGYMAQDSLLVTDEQGNNYYKYVYDKTSLDPWADFKKLLIKEVWYFDSRYSRLKCRIIGLCPIIERDENGRHDMKQSFWAYYPDVESYLVKQEVFSYQNDRNDISMHDMLQMRMFGSYVFKASNVVENRNIDTYATGIDGIIEAERIENEIFQKEHDMWQY